MPVKPGWPILALASVVCIGAIAMLAESDNRSGVGIVSVAYALFLAAAALATNAPLWRAPAHISPKAALSTTTRLTALAYAWSGAALFAVYLLTHVRWQHGWQYGLALTLIALGNWIYARRLDFAAAGAGLASPAAIDWAVRLAGLQGLSLAGALIWLAASGKLDTKKGDWVANAIFVAGGLAIIATSALILVSHAALTSRRARDAATE